MEITARKSKIIKAILATENESVLGLLEEDLNLFTKSDFFDVENNLFEEDIQELKKNIQENPTENTLSENEFWDLVNSWNKK